MKKIYTLGLSVLLAASSALAQGITARHFNDDTKGEVMTWKEVCSKFGDRTINAMSDQTLIGTVVETQSSEIPTTGISAPATPEALTEIKFDGSYKGMLNSNSGLHEGEASFIYYPATEEYK